jgi:hypothetical protein
MFNLSQIQSDYELDKNLSQPMEQTHKGETHSIKKNRTLKRRLAKTDLNNLPQPLSSDIYNSLDENEDNLGDFPPKPQSASVEMRQDNVADKAVSEQDYTLLGIGNEENQYAEKAYKQYLTTHQQWSPLLEQSQQTPGQMTSVDQSSTGADKPLLDKLNYMIHLLEDQQNEKTNNLTEELILYIFLGIFVIFVVDSFTKVGKYTR